MWSAACGETVGSLRQISSAQIDTIRTRCAARRPQSGMPGADRQSRASRAENAGHDRVCFGICATTGPSLDLTPPVSYAMHAHLIPSCYLERVAQTRTVHAGEPLRELAKRLRTPLYEPGGALAALSEARAKCKLHPPGPRAGRRCSNAPAPMSKGATGTCR